MSDKRKDLNSELKLKNDELNKLKSELNEIKYKFSEAEQIADIGFWEVDPSTLDPTWTEGCFKITGLDPEHGQPKYLDQKKIIHPDDWNYFSQTLTKVLETGNDEEIDIRFVKPDGSIRIFHIIGKPKKDDKGKIIAVRGIAQDITEQKKFEKKLEESEKRYRYIVEKATAGMFILDEAGVIKYLNEHMAQMLHYSKTEMLEQHIKDFVDEDEKFYRYRKPFEAQIERFNWFKILDKKGEVYWSNLTISPIFNNTKRYCGCLGIVTDINMQKGLEEAYIEREEIFTQIIYDMMDILNKMVKDKPDENFHNQDMKTDYSNN